MSSSYQISGYTRDDWDDERDYTRNNLSDERDCNRNNHKKHGHHNEEEVLNVLNANRHQLSEEVRCSLERVISIGATCIAEINGRFFLLVEIEIDVAGEEIEQVIIIRITQGQAAALLRAGIRQCRIVTTIPTGRAGEEVDLICVFVVGNFAFLVFDVENNRDELVLVRVPLCPII